MAQLIKQANIFGRIGSGLGQGLADQIPKEIERNRLSSGLQQFSQTHQDQSPIQQLAQLSAIPGVTPQMIQSFSELAKQQRQRDAYARSAQGMPAPQERASPNFREREFLDRVAPKREEMQRQSSTQKIIQEATQEGSPQIIEKEPLAEKALPRLPWTREQKTQRINEYQNQDFTPDMAKQLTAEDEQADLAEPGVYKQQYEEQKQRRDEARTELDRELQQQLQKSPKDIYADITGEMKSNLERSMERDLRLNPKMSIQDAARKWTTEALHLAKTKQDLDKYIKTFRIEEALKGREPLNKLKQYGKIFKNTGNQEEYYNILRGQMGLSSQGAASIAYEVSKDIANFIPTIQSSAKTNPIDNARKVATQLGEKITPQDSILSIVAHIKDHDTFFDENTFFDQLREDQEHLGLTPRQQRELAVGEAPKKKAWMDMAIFPWFGKR